MSEPTRDDLTIAVVEYLADHGMGNYPTDVLVALVDGMNLPAIVDADPRWVRREEMEAMREAGVTIRDQSLVTIRRHKAKIAEFERHYVRVTRDCDTCGGDGMYYNPVAGPGFGEPLPCDDCTDGKVPADGVFNVSQFTVEILAEVEIRADAPQYWLVPAEGADDE